MKSGQKFIALSAIFFITVVLRVWNWDFQPLGCDELYTVAIINQRFLDLFVFTLTNDCTPPLYYLLAHAAYVATGFSDVATRIPSIIFGILVIPAMYFLGKTYRDDITGMFAAAISAILYSLVYYSQFARAFEMELFVSIIFFTVFVFIQKQEMDTRTDKRVLMTDYAILGIIGAIAIWIHLFALIPVALTVLSLFLKTARRNALVASGIVFLSVVPLIPLFFSTAATRKAQAFPGLGINELLVFIPIEFFNIGLFVLIPLIILGIYLNKNDALSIHLIAIAALTFAIGIPLTVVSPVAPRYFYTVFPILLVFACSAIVWLVSHVKNKRAFSFAILALIELTQYGALLAQYTTMRLSC